MTKAFRLVLMFITLVIIYSFVIILWLPTLGNSSKWFKKLTDYLMDYLTDYSILRS
jgi:competence protein ComGC